MVTADVLANLPGMTDQSLTTEREFLWGTANMPYQFMPGVIVSTAADSGNTPTTTLRKGLAMGRVTSSGKFKQYDSTSTDGSEVLVGFLLNDHDTLDSSGTATDKGAVLLVAGPVLSGQVLPAITSNMRRWMAGRFLLDDDLAGNMMARRQAVSKTADYTVVAGTDNGKTFHVTGGSGVTFTLPTMVLGEEYWFVNEADQNMTVAAPANKLVIFNNATATSGAFSTAGNKIGAIAHVYANVDATKWIFEQLCKHTLTVA